MLSAAEYPFLDVFWTIVIFFAWAAWFWAVIAVLSDLFRRQDITGWARSFWAVAVIVLPFIGVLAYLGTQGQMMTERKDRVTSESFSTPAGAPTQGSAAEIEKGRELLDRGVVSPEEFEAIKARALANGPPVAR